MNTIAVNTPSGSYEIAVGSALLDSGAYLRQHLENRAVFLVSNTTVAPLYAHKIRAALGSRLLGEHLLPDGEQFKTLAEWQKLLAAMQSSGLRRDACVLALGGGVVGDIAGFAAACYMRGIDIMQCPTTLLAAVDSSVGGKTGVNIASGKNLIGAFKQPLAVCIDTAVLATLPAREYRAGLAEVVKYSLIDDAAFFSELAQSTSALSSMESACLLRVITHCCESKARVVAADEHEHGQRALLNLGHTFGHALESASDYQRWLHGEAVAIGLVCAAYLSEAVLGFDRAQTRQLISLLEQLDLPTRIPSEFGATRLWQLMQGDKKADASGLRFILMRAIGESEIVSGITREAACTAMQRCGASE